MTSESALLELIASKVSTLSRRQRAAIDDEIAEVSFRALGTVERAFAQASITHPIPLHVSRELLEKALPDEERRGRDAIGARLVRLQLQLLDAGRAKPSASDLDFQVFRGILEQHRIKL